MRFVYTILFYLALPFIFLRLLWRSRSQPAYRERIGERFGFYQQHLDGSIWVHAVSMGETLAAVPLVKALKQAHPHLPIIMTTMTPTGAEQVSKSLGSSVTHAFIPYDIPFAIKRFLTNFKPQCAIVMETELWPNLIAMCRAKDVPVCLTNARLSERSARGYQRIAWLTRPMLQSLAVIATHGHADAERFIKLGAPKEKVMVCGSLKFDLEITGTVRAQGDTLRKEIGRDRFVWIAASTHEGEESQLLAAHRTLVARDPKALLILVPRHPDRFDAVAELAAQNFKTARRSAKQNVTADVGVYLGDTMGELLILYGAADITFVGGSFIERGGHNMLEPAALEKAILTGPSDYNFAEISAQFVQHQALKKVANSAELAQTLIDLRDHPEQATQMANRAKTLLQANQGALQKQLHCIRTVVDREREI